MDANRFFKEATLRICSSLDIEVALWRCRQYISSTIPADRMYLNIYEPSINGLRYVASADQHGGRKMERSVPLPAEVIQAIEAGSRLQDHLIINHPDQDPMGRIITEALSLPPGSFIALRLFIEGQRLGVIDLFAEGHHRFTETHAKQFALLREPFAIAMANALKHQEVVELKEKLIWDNRELHSELRSQSGDEVIGAESGLKGVMTQVSQISHLSNTVLLIGETGTGKEVIANAIHRLSPRRNEPFIKVNCGAIPENLIDSELFGHEKGAFTGAVHRKRGRFERANNGTLFLDEIGELPPWAQIRLLRVLQTREIERVGGSMPIKLNIRVIAATHRNLQEMIASGAFREDLWFRINAFPVHIPPLSQRVEDIPLLVHHFIEKLSKAFGIHPQPVLTQDAVRRLSTHPWPGNVRELENAVERALIQHRHGVLNFNAVMLPAKKTDNTIALQRTEDVESLEDVMRRHIEAVLAMTGGKINGSGGAAQHLAIHPNTLRNRMRKLGIAFGRARTGD